MRITQLTPEEALASLHSDAAGPTAGEARRPPSTGRTASRNPKGGLAFRFLREFTHFFALIL